MCNDSTSRLHEQKCKVTPSVLRNRVYISILECGVPFFRIAIRNTGVEGVVCGLEGIHLADSCVLTKLE
jgi:hypothetical protein